MAITIGTNGWCSVDKVRNELPQVTTGPGTPVSVADHIEAAITRRFHDINGHLRNRGWTVSAVAGDAAALAWVERVNVIGAAMDLMRQLTAGPMGQLSPVVESYQVEYRDALRALSKGDVDLGDLDDGAESSSAQYVPTDYTLSTGDNYTPPLESDRVF